MTAQYGRPSLFDRLKAFAWWGEQKLVNALAVTFGVTIGLAQGSIHATKSLAPHFTSTAGLKHLYYGDPAASLSSQSQAYVRGSFASARLKSSGQSATLTSTPTDKTAVPTLVNGEASTAPPFKSSASEIQHYLPDGYTDKAIPSKDVTGGAQATTTPPSVTPPVASPADSEGDTETEEEDGSEYTSSAPTTPRSSVLAPPGDTVNGKEKKKRRKKLGKKIKKTFSKIADAITPGSHATS